MVTIFMGGTCNESTWREELLSKLDLTRVNPFNPVVEDWNEEAQKNEDIHKITDDLCLYCLTPEMTGHYSIFELGYDLGRRPEQTVFCILAERDGKAFTDGQLRGFTKMQQDVTAAGGHAFSNLDELANFLNTYDKQKHF